MVLSIRLSGPIALAVSALGALWIYRDGKYRGMESADMWAVGFFVAFWLLPILGGVLVFAYYLQKRDPQYPQPGMAPEK